MTSYPFLVYTFDDLKIHLLYEALNHRNLNLVRCLLNEGTKIFIDPENPDRRFGGGYELLRDAVKNNDFELLNILIENGVNLNFKLEKMQWDTTNRTARENAEKTHPLGWKKTGFYYGLFSYVNSPEMIELLLDYGVEMTEEDIKDNKFLKEYLEYKRVQQRLSLARALETFGTDFDTMRKLGETYTKYQKGKGKYSKKRKQKKSK
tara:strand:+ start:502 stop:1119 length:618 start_codon:yes stop_codon:yes gene_type:complete